MTPIRRRSARRRGSGWWNDRLPVARFLRRHLADYQVPRNLNIWYCFGSLALLVLANQVLTGLWLTMAYTPTVDGAFASIQRLMRDVEWGWLIRHLHTTGASALFLVMYLHMFRSLLYGSYKAPRELVWIFGMAMYLILMAEAFTGYLLPWGQMSYWGAQVITSLFAIIPAIGPDLAEWVRGDYVVSGITLKRFFALHVVALPLVLLALVVLHLVALHEVGSNNPDGIEIRDRLDASGRPLDGIPFHPYYTVKDLLGVAVFLFVFCVVVFYFPEGGGYLIEAGNAEPADPLQMPERIEPLWYFTPFYAMLRGVTVSVWGLSAQLLGALTMGLAIGLLFVLPWLDRSPVRSMRYRGWMSRLMLGLFVLCFLTLGIVGALPVTQARTAIAQVCTLGYFAYFLLMPLYTRWESPHSLPARVTRR